MNRDREIKMNCGERLAFYSNPIYSTAVNSTKSEQPGRIHPNSCVKRVHGEGFVEDDRNIGGKDSIRDQHSKHKAALKQVVSFVGEQ